MLKGFIVIFTMVISMILFKRNYNLSQKFGVLFVISGLFIVGSSNLHSYNSRFAPRPLLGNILVIFAQVFLAGMFVYEEKILKEYRIRVLEIVGWEGVWGMIFSTIFVLIFFLIPGEDFGCLENPVQATLQVANNYKILLAMMISTLVMGPFNYYGTNLTKYASAMHRCLIDSSRMCIIWFIAICCSWEKFTPYQAIGYCLIMNGNLLYYEIVSIDKWLKQESKDPEICNTENTPIKDEQVYETSPTLDGDFSAPNFQNDIAMNETNCESNNDSKHGKSTSIDHLLGESG
mmetsp:Transcript_16575/g.17257  ORF Transcript_16575/g.17257 Transcript_16575/m.17257 type:complete len:290 (+) Transcript_16575:225-1094(+)